MQKCIKSKPFVVSCCNKIFKLKIETDRTQSCELFGLNTEQLVVMMVVVLVVMLVMLVMGAKSVKSISRNLNYTNSPHPPL